MKPATLITILCIFCIQTLKSQDSLQVSNFSDTPTTSRTYMAYIYQNYKRRVEKGYLMNINDSAVYLSEKKMSLNFSNSNMINSQMYNYRQIDKIILKKPGTLVTSIVIGVLAGAILGAVIGHSGGDDHGLFALSAEDKAYIGAFIGAGAGVLMGAIIAHESQKKFLINGEWKSLQEMKESLSHR